MHIPPPHPDPWQRAVDDANQAIRAIVRGYPAGRMPPPGLRPEYDAAVEVYNAAVIARNRAREPEEEPAPALVLAA